MSILLTTFVKPYGMSLYWTGSSFSSDVQDASLFTDLPDTDNDMAVIQAQYPDVDIMPQEAGLRPLNVTPRELELLVRLLGHHTSATGGLSNLYDRIIERHEFSLGEPFPVARQGSTVLSVPK